MNYEYTILQFERDLEIIRILFSSRNSELSLKF